VVHAAEFEHGGPSQPRDWRDQAHHDAPRPGAALRDGDAVERNPLICEFGANRLASSISTRWRHRVHAADPASRPRRIAIASDDTIWYGDYSRGYLGKFNPKTRETKEWPSPSGPQSQPYGITVINDIVWYNESAIRPNTLVRFDPKTEKFQSWIIPGGGGVVRNMMPRATVTSRSRKARESRGLVEIPKVAPARGTR